MPPDDYKHRSCGVSSTAVPSSSCVSAFTDSVPCAQFGPVPNTVGSRASHSRWCNPILNVALLTDVCKVCAWRTVVTSTRGAATLSFVLVDLCSRCVGFCVLPLFISIDINTVGFCGIGLVAGLLDGPLCTLFYPFLPFSSHSVSAFSHGDDAFGFWLLATRRSAGWVVSHVTFP